MNIKQYVLGAPNVPEWFNEVCGSGKVKLKYDEDGKLEGAVVYSPSGTAAAEPGDTILMLRSGPQVMKKDKNRKDHAEKNKQETE